MGDQFWFSEAQLRQIKPYFPLAHGVPRVDDRRVVSGIIHVIRNGLRWRDAPATENRGGPPGFPPVKSAGGFGGIAAAFCRI